MPRFGDLPRLGRSQSVTVRPAEERIGRGQLDRHLRRLGSDGETARLLDAEADALMATVTSLSSLTATLAMDYLDRLARPVPALTPDVGVQIVGRSYVAHMAFEADSKRFGSPDVPVLGTLPPLKRGRPPQDLLTRVVKASRRSFEALCGLSPPAWEGFVWCLAKRAHDAAAGGDLVAVEPLDGVARFAWVLRQVDLHYGLSPARS